MADSTERDTRAQREHPVIVALRAAGAAAESAEKATRRLERVDQSVLVPENVEMVQAAAAHLDYVVRALEWVAYPLAQDRDHYHPPRWEHEADG